MSSAFAFLGDFHPVAVHFPIALLPSILLLKLFHRLRPQPWIPGAVGGLLLLAFACSLLAVALGMTNRNVNGHQGEAVELHALLGFSTLAAVALATALHFHSSWIEARLRSVWRPLSQVFLLIIGLFRYLLRVGKWLLMILLFPLALAWLLLRWIWRKTLGPGLQPRLAAGLRQFKAQAKQLWARIRQACAGLDVSAADLAYAASLLLVLATGMKGANISHGETHLTRNMPPTLASWLGEENHREANAQLDPAFYEHKLLPIFRRSCIKCHGEDKQRGGLRLDSYEHLTGSSALHWQNPWGSEIVKRLLLPPDDPAVMPPAGKSRPLRSQDLADLIAWLQGHSLASLAQQGGGLPVELLELSDSLEQIEDEGLSRLQAIEGLRVMRLAEHSDLLIVNLSHVEPNEQTKAIKALQPYTLHIVQLSWCGRDIRQQDWTQIAAMKNLRQMDLSRSMVDAQQLRKLAAMPALWRLNLSGTETGISAREIESLLPGVRRLYLPELAAGETNKS